MWMSELPPFVPFFIAALLAMMTRGWLRNLILLATPVLGGLHLWFDVSPGIITSVSIMEFELQLMRTDLLSLLFGYLFHIASFIAVVFALQVRDTTQYVSSMVYAGSALGAVFAGDLITLFIFWELLAISSVFLIWARRSERAIRAGMRYLVFQVSSGLAAARRCTAAL
jgi:multicomponent Na+:H+ antiporter subunit D